MRFLAVFLLITMTLITSYADELPPPDGEPVSSADFCNYMDMHMHDVQPICATSKFDCLQVFREKEELYKGLCSCMAGEELSSEKIRKLEEYVDLEDGSFGTAYSCCARFINRPSFKFCNK